MKAIKLLAAAAALSIAASAVLAPSAVAAPPGCDWNTDAGVQACMGGGPMDAGKNGQGDTYGGPSRSGPSGEDGFIRYVSPSFPGSPRQGLLKDGYAVCAAMAKGIAPSDIRDAIARKGIPVRPAENLVTASWTYLCP